MGRSRSSTPAGCSRPADVAAHLRPVRVRRATCASSTSTAPRPPTELDGASAFAYGGLGTRCTHWFDDPAGHALDVVVTQFPSADVAERRWRAADPGRSSRSPGRTDACSSCPESASFVLRADDPDRRGALLRRRGATSAIAPRPSGAVDAGGRRPPSTSTSPTAPRSPDRCRRATASTGTVGGTPYVEPCALLDAAAFEALGGPPPEPVVVDTSVIRHDPYANAAVSSCERSGTLPRRRTAPDPLDLRRARGARRPRPGAARSRCSTSTSPTATRRAPEIRDLDGVRRDGVRRRRRAPPGATRCAPASCTSCSGPTSCGSAAVRDVGPKDQAGRAARREAAAGRRDRRPWPRRWTAAPAPVP